MKIDVLTLFPGMFDGILNESIIKRAINKGLVEINVHDIRKYTKDKHNRVDDYQIGGGEGMVLMPEPIYYALEDLKSSDSITIMLTPQGRPYKQTMAYSFTNYKHIILLCGHYEGFDERIRSMVDMEVSIGDYVLTGGEIPSMVIIDSVVRLIDGVIDSSSHENDSFNNNLLDYPVYTKPIDFMGNVVPDILLSGNHELINKWRYEEALKKTKERRPDLLERDDKNV